MEKNPKPNPRAWANTFTFGPELKNRSALVKRKKNSETKTIALRDSRANDLELE